MSARPELSTRICGGEVIDRQQTCKIRVHLFKFLEGPKSLPISAVMAYLFQRECSVLLVLREDRLAIVHRQKWLAGRWNRSLSIVFIEHVDANYPGTEYFGTPLPLRRGCASVFLALTR